MTLSSTNPMRTVLMTLLLFEIVVFGLAIPVMIFLSDVSGGTAAAIGIGAALLAGISAGLMRRPVGYIFGWFTQIIAVALGLVTTSMYAIGGLFLVLWVISFVLGKRLDAARGESLA